MQMTKTLSRESLWYLRNCINDKNLEYIEDLLNHYKLNDWKEIINGYGDLDLIIQKDLKTFKITVNKETMSLSLFERNKCANIKDQEFYHIVNNAGDNGKFTGEDVWIDILRFINKGVRKNGTN